MEVTYDSVIDCAIDVVGDSDTFRFVAGAGETVNVRAFTMQGDMDVHLELYDPEGGRIFANVFGDRQPALQGKLGKSGVYTVRLLDYRNDQTGSYRFYLERISPPTPGATPISFSENRTGDISLLGEADQFSFTAEAGETVNVRAFTMQGDMDVHLELYDPEGGRIFANVFGDRQPALQGKLGKSGVYTVRLLDYRNDQTGSYRFYLERISPPTPGATSISFSENRTGDISLLGEADQFSFAAEAGETVNVRAFTMQGDMDVHLELYDPEGGRIFANVFGDRQPALQGKLGKSGVYTVRLLDYRNDQTGSYRFYLERISPPTPGATPISFSENRTGDISLLGEADQFYFQGQAADTVIIEVTALSSTGSPHLELYEPGGGRLFANVFGDRQPSLRGKLKTSGLHSIRVLDYGNNETPSYRIDLQCIGVCPVNPPPTCSYSLSPSSQLFPADGGPGSLGVLTQPDCPWTAVSGAPHLTISSGFSGTGSGTVRYTVAPNNAAAARSGTLSIASQTATITQSGTAPLLFVSPSALVFDYRQGGPLPSERILSVFTNAPSLEFAVATSGESWLAVSPAAGSAPASLIVSIAPADLAPGDYQATITVTAGAASPPSVAVPVALHVEAAGPPKLSVESADLTFAFPQGAQPRSVRRAVTNQGGGTLPFTVSASTNSGGDWLRVTPSSGEARLSDPASLIITADPGGLPPGTYTGNIRVTAGEDHVDVAVTMSVSAVQQTIRLSQAGLTFVAVAEGGTPPQQSFGVLNAGQGIMDWSASASTVTGGPWLSVTPTVGSSDASSPDVPPVEVSVNPAGLAVGDYYGQIQVTSASADNVLQVVSVILNVLPPGSDPGPVVQPTSLIFTAAAGGSEPEVQTIRISNLTELGKSFVTGRLTVDGAPWFSVAPVTGAIVPGQSASIQVNASSAGLTPGIRRGVLTLLFADGAVRTVNLLFALGNEAAADAQRDAEQTCTPTRLLPLISSLGAGFTVPAGWPTPLDARVIDDCGNPLRDGSVVATFSNGDPPLPLISLRDGRWSQTWQARNSDVAQLKVTVTADLPGKELRGATEITGSLRLNTEEPVLASGGVLNAASFALGRPVSPGSMVSVFGRKLSDGEAKSPSLPLETQLAGALVVVGGKPAPLIVATEQQINAVLPYGLAPNTQHQVVLRRGNRYTVPETITVAVAQPAIFAKDASGHGQGVIIREDGQWAEPGTPAAAGTAVVIYATGLGEVNPPVAAGQAAPAEPLSKVTSDVKLTIGGVEAQLLFAGLTPGFTGLYQVNAVVPPGAGAGDAVPVVLSVSGQPSPVVTMAVQ